MKKAVLLINLGTPAAPNKSAVKDFLKLFLADKRVINLPRILWWPILHSFVLPAYSQQSAKRYRQIWSDETGSPLAYYTEKQAQQLQKLLPDSQIEYAYSYSHPLIEEALKKLSDNGADEITCIAMDPQYSTTTGGAIADSIHSFFLGKTQVPNLRLITHFYDRQDYIQALSSDINQALGNHDYDALLLSYHGLPQKYVDQGDPYAMQCQENTSLLKDHLPADLKIIQSYQSKFGPGQWLLPATDEMLKELPQQGIKRILIAAPAFLSDCIETIQELGVENRQIFMQAGGKRFDLLPCLNDQLSLTQVFANMVLNRA